MIKLIKDIIKKIIRKSQWRIKKIYLNKTYTNQKPNLDLITEIYNSSGIVHMGAHRGTEAPIYDWLHKKTIWIEANPIVFDDLKDNVCQFINQKAYNVLLYDEDDKEVNFNISNNDSASSSVYDFGEKSLSMNLKMISKLKLNSKKFDTLVEEISLDISDYNFWILDLQGAELLALKGAKQSLKKCKSILIEISKEEYYINGAKWEELKYFLNEFGFHNKLEPESSHSDVLFTKK